MLQIGVGPELVAARWLDGQIHTGMLFTLIGVFTGLVAGITSIVALYQATLRSNSSGVANRYERARRQGNNDADLVCMPRCWVHFVWGR
jgi:hypothetical protein